MPWRERQGDIGHLQPMPMSASTAQLEVVDPLPERICVPGSVGSAPIVGQLKRGIVHRAPTKKVWQGVPEPLDREVLT